MAILKNTIFNQDNKQEIVTIIILALPVIAESFLQIFLGTVDVFFAGQINDNAIAAISVTNLIINIFLAFYTAVSVGTTAVISRNIGRNDMIQANSAVKQSIILGVFLSLLLGIISLILYRPILNLSGADGMILKYAVPYYLIVAVPSIFLCLSLILSSCLRAAKDTKTPMFANGIANIVNLCLNYLFIRLEFGIMGLALATTVSRMVGMVILFIRLSKGLNGLQIIWQDWHIDKKLFGTITKIGIPAGLEKIIMRLGQLLYGGMIISIGTEAFVAHNIAGNIEGYSYMPAMGLGIAVMTLVGNSLGENNPGKARRQTYIANSLAMASMVCAGIVFYIFAPKLAEIFSETKEVQNLVIMVLRFIAIFQPFEAITQIFTYALQGAGDTKFPMYATLIGIWGARIGIGYWLAVINGMGLMGVWWGYALDSTIRGLLLFYRFRRGKWQRIEI